MKKRRNIFVLLAALFLMFNLTGKVNAAELQAIRDDSFTVTVDQSQYYVKEGETLTVVATITTPDEYVAGSHKYIGYYAYYNKNHWEQLASWYIDGGTSRITLRMEIDSSIEKGARIFVVSVFPADNFATGGSLYDKDFLVHVSESTHTLYFDADGGTCPKSNMTVTYGLNYPELPVPEKAGYIFGGWYTGKNGSGTKISERMTVNAKSDETVYAMWQKDTINLSTCTISLAYTSTTYSGSAKKPKVTVKDPSGNVRTNDEDYKVVYSNNTNAGTAKVTITGIGDLRGSVEKTFTIKKANNTITVNANFTKVYATSAKTFSLGATAKGSAKLTYRSSKTAVKVNSGGTVTIPAKYIGGVTFTITAAETKNYKKATATTTLKVNPKRTTLTAVKALSAPGKVRIEWKKNPSVSGYDIIFSPTSDFKRNGSPNGEIKADTTYLILTNLPSGKMYFKIRGYKTVGSDKYYGAWSSLMSCRVK